MRVNVSPSSSFERIFTYWLPK